MESEQVLKSSVRKLVCFSLVIAIFIMLVPPAMGATAEIKNFSVTPDKPAYYIGEIPNIKVEFEYENLGANTNLTLQIYNSTSDLVKAIDLGSFSGNGTYSQSHTLDATFTEESGSFSYTAKLLDKDTNYKLAEASFTINVQVESFMLSVAWIDASQDRKVDINEQVTFSIFIQWSFANESRTLSLIVIVSGNEFTITTVNVTVGSGQDEATWSTSFGTSGLHLVVFELRNAESQVLASTSVNIQVGEVTTQQAGFWQIVNQWLPYIALVLMLVAVIVLVIKK